MILAKPVVDLKKTAFVEQVMYNHRYSATVYTITIN